MPCTEERPTILASLVPLPGAKNITRPCALWAALAPLQLPARQLRWPSRQLCWLSRQLRWLSRQLCWPSRQLCWPSRQLRWPSRLTLANSYPGREDATLIKLNATSKAAALKWRSLRLGLFLVCISHMTYGKILVLAICLENVLNLNWLNEQALVPTVNRTNAR